MQADKPAKHLGQAVVGDNNHPADKVCTHTPNYCYAAKLFLIQDTNLAIKVIFVCLSHAGDTTYRLVAVWAELKRPAVLHKL